MDCYFHQYVAETFGYAKNTGAWKAKQKSFTSKRLDATK
jgi:hypothetical protein